MMNDEFTLPTGQEMTGILYEQPAYTIIFIVVQWNEMDFSFINRVQNRFSFKWERWKKWKSLLKPFTCHAFLCESYNTKTASSQGFKPIEHIMQFSGIDEARRFNAQYLEQYRRWNDQASAEMATEETLKFVEKMLDFDEIRIRHQKEIMQESYNHFADEEFLEMVRWVTETSKLPSNEIPVDEDCDFMRLLDEDCLD